METMRLATATLGAGLALLVAGSALGQATDASISTERCQKMTQKEVAKYVKLRQLAIATCLQKIAQRVVKDNQSVVDVSGATSSCLSQFYKLGRSDGKSLAEKMEDKIRAFCDPTDPDFKGDHVADDVSGTGTPGVNQPLDVAVELDTYCGHFGMGSASPTQWIGCLQAAAECQVHQQVAVEFGRALEWLNLMDAEFTESSDPKKPDAQAALRAVEQAIDGAIDDDVPNLKCGPGLVPGGNPVLPATGQTTSQKTGDDGDIQAGAPLSYTDNGDGTITDNNTGLIWAKKDAGGGIHDWGNTYTWDETFDVYIAALNSLAFAGHTDWRMPNYKELVSILDLKRWDPVADPVFHTNCAPGCTVDGVGGPACSCTNQADYGYWSSTVYGNNLTTRWAVWFNHGYVTETAKTERYYARAVRGGL